MNITNNKNGCRGQIIDQEYLTNGQPCPVKALAELIHNILINFRTTNENIAVVYTNGKKGGIKPPHISKTVK